MELPNILHMLSPTKHVSPFDVNMAHDAGFDVTSPYINVELGEVNGLVQDAIFSRGPKGVKRTGIFIAGKNALEALDMLEEARKALVPPFECSIFADPAGSFTTAAAMVACTEAKLKEKFDGGLKGRKVVVYGATGVVGYCSSVIAGLEGAEVVMVGYDGEKRVKQGAKDAKERFEVELGYADGSTEDKKVALLKGADVVFAAGKAGLQLLSADQIAQADSLKVAADVNAVPPAGIEGVDVQADGEPLGDKGAVGIGALAVGNVKYKTESGLFKRMIESDKPLCLDFRDAFELARSLVA